MGRMAGVAGGSLAPRLQAVAAHIAFVAECHIHVSWGPQEGGGHLWEGS